MFLKGRERKIHYLAPDNVQPDYPIVYLTWNVDCQLGGEFYENEDEQNNNEKWNRNKYNFLEEMEE
jgi:hypothetical protein